MLQPCPTPRPIEEPLHIVYLLCRNAQIPCAPHSEKKTSPCLHFKTCPHLMGWDSTKLKDWLTNLEMATDILKESWTHLTKAKSHGLTCTLICEALQTEKCWDNIKGILHLNLSNANIHTYTSCFMEIQQRDNETLAAYVHWFKREAKMCSFNSPTATICIFITGLWDAHNITAKIYKRTPRLYWKSSS